MVKAGGARLALLLMAASVFLALGQGVAQAHALLVSSEPSAGARLGTAPGIVVLHFSEPVTPKLSLARVTDPAGHEFTGHGSGTEISVPLATNALGPYRVQWTSVSADDGHTVRGSFQFTVVAPSARGSTAAISTNGSSAALSAFRTIEYVALLLAIGLLLIRRLAKRDPRIAWVKRRGMVSGALAVSLFAALVVVTLEASEASSIGGTLRYLTTGVPGTARFVFLVAIGFAVLASVLSVPVSPFLLVAVSGLAASGHGASAHPMWWGVAVDAGHLLAAGLWAGGIMALATLRPPGGYRGPEARRLLDRFSPVAITAFLVTVGLGVVQAFQDVGSLHALFATDYGRVLSIKVVAVGAMIPLSVLAWRRRLAPRAEGLIAVAVVTAAALLAAYPLPASQLAQASAARSPTGRSATSVPNGTVTSALPRPGDLTLGGHAGQILLGLTVRPAKPGPNQLLVYVLPIQGKAQDIPIKVSLAGRPLRVRACGPNCRSSEADLAGGERIAIAAAGSAGGTETFDLPALPAADGTALLDRAQQRMHELTSYRQDDSLNSGLATVKSKYAFVAPGRMESVVNEESVIWVGTTRYIQSHPGAKWEAQPGGPSIPVPSFIWDYFKPFIAPRILGTETVDGQKAQVLAFFGLSGSTGVWFRLWVDPQGLVVQAQMRADGHFMDDRFYDFDAPITIQAPVG